MFTGIIESIGVIKKIEADQSNLHFTVQSAISNQLKIDQSVSHNGVCLTVVQQEDDSHVVTAIAETLSKTNLGQLNIGDEVNLERCMPAHGRFDGHIVQGHVDQVAVCQQILHQNGSHVFTFKYAPSLHEMIVEKGSICVNGISLTAFNTTANTFDVAIIPYTFAHTNLHTIKPTDTVNLEFDIIGKYISKIAQLQNIITQV